MFTHISGVRVHHCMGFDLDTCVHECVSLILCTTGMQPMRVRVNMHLYECAHSVHSIGGRVRVVLTVYVASRVGGLCGLKTRPLGQTSYEMNN